MLCADLPAHARTHLFPVTTTLAASLASNDRVRAAPISSAWPLYAVVLASTCIVVGLIWDISWHRTIGRDTFWTPAHLLEQSAAIIASLSCGFLVLRTTFRGTPEEKAGSVRFWHYFYGPLGAWVCIWGTLMLITSAPFDNWWHDAYGLDVTILSPPHMVLAAGMVAIQIGAMLMTLRAQNRATAVTQPKLNAIHAYAAGILLTMVATAIIEKAGLGNQMHSAAFYILTGWVIPLFLVGLARASHVKWPATTITAIYMAITIAMSWILQLFPATPMLAPIYNPVSHMVPPPFPLLLVVPAFTLDLLMKRFGMRNDWMLAAAIGVMWVLVMLAVHWFWADFLLSPGARNYFIGADQWSYSDRPNNWRYRYWGLDVDAAGNWSPSLFFKGIGIAVVASAIAARVSLFLGYAMSRVKR